VFAQRVDLKIALISMILIFILEETHGTYNYFRTFNSSHIFKEEKNLMGQKRLYKPSELYKKGGCP
jgi:hypothetical protein